MATMRSSASSNGPGIGARPSAASPRSGRGMRLSVAAIFTARRVLLRLLMEQRDLKWGRLLPYRPGTSARAAERRRRAGRVGRRTSGERRPNCRGGDLVGSPASGHRRALNVLASPEDIKRSSGAFSSPMHASARAAERRRRGMRGRNYPLRYRLISFSQRSGGQTQPFITRGKGSRFEGCTVSEKAWL